MSREVGRRTGIDAQPPKLHAGKALFGVLAAISFCHLLNDMAQSLIPAIYPILKSSFHLDFGQIGLITFTYQVVASLLQPFVGLYTDRRPKPFSLPVGMGFTLIGLLLLAVANSFPMLLLGAAFVGMGSSVFHPESSRVARLASGGQHGLAQSVFQVGGNAGSALGPLLAAFIVVPHGQHSIAWFSIASLIGIVILTGVGRWYRTNGLANLKAKQRAGHALLLPRKKVALALVVLTILVFSKFFYLASLSSYYTFYLISKFHVSVRASQILLFAFLGATVAGTLIGGPVGDRFGRKHVIWWS
ncbi:MAG: MFS transporter, partial [Acidobacteriaceae bacterium]|nr:MFS transporter [Acidobacteriaceae bacterium]